MNIGEIRSFLALEIWYLLKENIDVTCIILINGRRKDVHEIEGYCVWLQILCA